MMNKKGTVDAILIVLMLFVTAVVFLFAYVIQSNIDTAMSPALENVTSGSSVGITTVTSIFQNTLDYLFLAVFFGLIIGLLITSFFTPTHPVFFVFDIILFIGLVFTAVTISNTYESLTTSSGGLFTSAVNDLPIMDYIMLHLPYIALLIGVLAAIIVYSRIGNMGGGIAGGMSATP